jgi:hypothetical protein
MTERVSPLLKTTWGQTGDYAKKVTELGWSNNDIGCQCLALAQILYYHRLQPHRSGTNYYTCRAKNKPSHKISLLFEEDYEHSFEEFPVHFVSGSTPTDKMALVQSYLFDVAKAYRKNFYTGYVYDGRQSVEILKTHFDIDAEYYYYLVDGALEVTAGREHEDLVGEYGKRNMDDAKALIKTELLANRPLWMYINRAAIGPKMWSDIWGKGVTTAKFYTAVDTATGTATTYLFSLKETPETESDQNVEIREVNNGIAGNVVWSTHWDEGWTTATFFTASGTTFLFALKKTAQYDGETNVIVYEMDGGRIGDIVWSDDWSDGWTTAEFYTTHVGGDEMTYLFLLKETAQYAEERNAVIRKMSGARVGGETWSDHWDDGWTTAKLYTIDGTTHLLLLKEKPHDQGEDSAVIREATIKGTVGDVLWREQLEDGWTTGWTAANFYTITDPSTGQDTTYLFRLKETPEGRNERNVAIHEMGSGAPGRTVETRRWSPGWTTAEFYTISGKTYLFLLKENQLDPHGNNVTTHEMKEKCDGHAVVVDGFEEDNDGKFSICLKYGANSPHNSTVGGDPKWVELEKHIHDLDGEQRRFIRIEPR